MYTCYCKKMLKSIMLDINIQRDPADLSKFGGTYLCTYSPPQNTTHNLVHT